MQAYSYIVAGAVILGIIILIITLIVIARKVYKENNDIVVSCLLSVLATMLVGLIFIIINSVHNGTFLTAKSDKECVCKDTR